MKIERTKNAIRNTKWGFLQKLVNILCPFVIRAILINTLSAEHAGLSSLFTSILQILSLTELGFSSAIVYSMYKPIASDNKEQVCALLNIYRKAYLIIGSVIFVIGVALMPLLPHLIDGDIPPDTNLYLLYFIYLINNVISYFLYGYKTSLLSAYQREDVISRNTLLYNVVLYGVQCIVLLLFKNYYVYAITIPLATIMLNILNNKAVNKMFPDFVPRGTISTEDKRELKKNLVGLMIFKVGGATRNTFDSIVVSMYLGLFSVAVYNNYFSIINGISSLLYVILTAITAGVGNKMAMESPQTNYEDFKKFHFYYMWISGWCTACMMCMFQPFMKIWMGEDKLFPEYIMLLFCYYFIMMKQGDISYVYYQAAGLWWRGKYRSIIEAILNLALNFFLGKLWGVLGIILATIISFTCVYFYGSKFIFTDYFKNTKHISYLAENILFLTVTLGTSILSYRLLAMVKLAMNLSSGVELVAGILICLFVPNIIFMIIYSFSNRYRLYIMDAIGKVNKYIRK